MYAITISPKYRGFASPKYIYNDDKPLIMKYLNKMSNHYCLYPEFDANHRLHYHGIINIKDMIKFRHLKHLIDKLIGFVKIEKIKDHNNHLKFLIYSMKQWAENKEYFESPIIYSNLRRRKKINKIVPPKISILDYF